MATYQADAAQAGVQPRAGIHTHTRYFEFTVDTALAVDDVIELVKIPENGRVLDLALDVPDLDTGGTPAIVFDVGDGDDQDRYISGSTTGQGGGSITTTDLRAPGLGIGHQYSSTDTIDLTVTTGPATGATGVTLKGWVTYSVED